MKSKKQVLYKIRNRILTVLSFVMMITMFVAKPVSVHAEDPWETPETEEIALIEGFYCLHPHKGTPTPWDPVTMVATPSTDYDGYSQVTLNKIAAAVLMRGDYYLSSNITVDSSQLQQTIWAIVCDKSYNGVNEHLREQKIAQGYYDYLMNNYTKIEGKYQMTIWKSTNDEYQDVLEAKLVEKHSVPTVVKKVMDSDDSLRPGPDGAGWQDSADHDIGDSIPFMITATLGDLIGFQSYYLEFADQMTHMTLEPSSVQVMVDGVDKTGDFEVSWSNETKKLYVECSDVIAIGAHSNSNIVLTYNAILNEDAVVGDEGNPNVVYLIYSRYPDKYGYSRTPEDKVVVFTYKFVANKVDGNKMPLGGAAFELFKWYADENGGGRYESLGVLGAVKNPDGTYTADGNNETTFTWSGIDDGKYKLVEVVTPSGYNSIRPIEFTYTALHDHLSENPVFYYLTADYVFEDAAPAYDEQGALTGSIIYEAEINATIVNSGSVALPQTGGSGAGMMYLAGTFLTLVSAVLLWTKKIA